MPHVWYIFRWSQCNTEVLLLTGGGPLYIPTKILIPKRFCLCGIVIFAALEMNAEIFKILTDLERTVMNPFGGEVFFYSPFEKETMPPSVPLSLLVSGINRQRCPGTHSTIRTTIYFGAQFLHPPLFSEWAMPALQWLDLNASIVSEDPEKAGYF